MASATDIPNWKKYESQICAKLMKRAGGSANVEADKKIVGRYSEVDRQIDVWLEGSFVGFPVTVAVDCKCWSSAVDVSDVERFLGWCDDVGVTHGLLITTLGFTPAGKKRSLAHPGVTLEVEEFGALDLWDPVMRVRFDGFNAGESTALLRWYETDEGPVIVAVNDAGTSVTNAFGELYARVRDDLLGGRPPRWIEHYPYSAVKRKPTWDEVVQPGSPQWVALTQAEVADVLHKARPMALGANVDLRTRR